MSFTCAGLHGCDYNATNGIADMIRHLEKMHRESCADLRYTVEGIKCDECDHHADSGYLLLFHMRQTHEEEDHYTIKCDKVSSSRLTVVLASTALVYLHFLPQLLRLKVLLTDTSVPLFRQCIAQCDDVFHENTDLQRHKKKLHSDPPHAEICEVRGILALPC